MLRKVPLFKQTQTSFRVFERIKTFQGVSKACQIVPFRHMASNTLRPFRVLVVLDKAAESSLSLTRADCWMHSMLILATCSTLRLRFLNWSCFWSRTLSYAILCVWQGSFLCLLELKTVAPLLTFKQLILPTVLTLDSLQFEFHLLSYLVVHQFFTGSLQVGDVSVSL